MEAQSYDNRESIRQESLVHDYLAKSGKNGITPRYYGLFGNSRGTLVLVLGNGGIPLESFENITTEEAQMILEKAAELHSAGILHRDLRPRNFVRDPAGDLKIIDFHLATTGHRCSGKDRCTELKRLRNALAAREPKREYEYFHERRFRPESDSD
ncbi:hypothetical protein R3P38DRAFT_2924010 [Favolaschia claudopus]|uniref:Protein kinase domain-containing protein n=1 Tax=Favolaschia claudopus TaxID=2862362 RepID=A0AAW0BVM1_9AGAR